VHPGSYTGLDFNAAGIAFLPKVARPAGPRFGAGRRPEPALPDRSFDAVIDVEASHFYPDFERFLGEVARVLRPGGHFRYADLGNRDGIPAWEAALASLPMRLVSRRVIDDQVLRGLHKNSPRSTELINRNSPSFLRRSGCEFAILNGSLFYRDLERRNHLPRLLLHKGLSFVVVPAADESSEHGNRFAPAVAAARWLARHSMMPNHRRRCSPWSTAR